MSRFLLIGIDGAEPSLIEPWMEQGLLPHLRRLRDRGGFTPLASTTPPATFPAWTTCVTGVNPGRHGVFDFTEIISGRHAVQFINSTFRKAPALWNILSAAGKRVCVLGVPATYPPEPVNGCMVSGFDSPVCAGIDRSFVYPKELYTEVADWRFADFQESKIGPGWHEAALPKLLEKIAVKERIAARLLDREPWDFFMVVFGESDTVAHHFWMFHDRSSPRYVKGGPEDAILRVYQRLDEAVGTLMFVAGDDVTVAVVSDHGFGGAGTGVLHLNSWLAEHGYLQFAHAGRMPALQGSLAKKAALGLVPHAWRGMLFRRFAGMAAGAESHSRFGGIDWEHTRAWSEELNYFPSIRINLKENSATDYEAFCEQLCRDLESWPPIKKAWRRDELYVGEHVGKAPDIILELELENGYSYSCLRSRGGPLFRRIRPEEYMGGKERGMNGNHRPTGILLLSKPIAASAASIEDIAPTVLAELGVAGPPMDGTALSDGSHIPPGSFPSSTWERVPCRAYTPEHQRVIEERLRALGYLE